MQVRRGKKAVFWKGICVMLGLVLFFFVASLAMGGEEGVVGHGAPPQDRGDLRDLLYRAINFALLVIILAWGMKKFRLKEFFSSRREEIRKRLEELKKEKEHAEKRFHELEERLKDFEAKKTEMVEQFRAEGLAEKEKIIAEAKKRSKQILEQTEQTIQREIQAAKERLKNEIVDVAAQKAQKMISREMKDTDHEHLIHEFIERVEKLH